MLYMFTTENLWQYAVLSAMGSEPRVLLTIIFVQTGLCGLLGTGMGIGLCAIVGRVSAITANYPFRMMWFTPLVGRTAVVLVSTVVAALSARPVLALQPMVVFTRRYTDSRQPFCKGKRLR
jgi:putative ABC transport system permease protein